MIIRPEQMQSLREAMTSRFVDESANRLRARFPDKIMRLYPAPSDLTTRVQSAIAEALARGISGGDDLRLYIDCLALVGPTFPTECPWAMAILNRSDIDTHAKMMLVNEYLIFGMDEPL
jgi:hypothetical protein